MVAIVTDADLDSTTLPIVGGKVKAQDPTKAPNTLSGFDPGNAVPVQNGDTVGQALGKLQGQVTQALEGANTYYSYQNNTGADMNPGTPVFLSSPTQVLGAIGNLVGRRVIGLYADSSVLPWLGVGNFLVEGSLVLTALQWQQITGDVGGLQPGQRYFLDLHVPGALRSTVTSEGAPASSYLVPVGYALSATEFVLDLQPVIRLA